MSVELKGSIFRGYVRWLRSAGMFDAVRAEVPAAVQAQLDDPPLPTEWLVARDSTLVIVEAVAAVRDLATVRRMSREAAAAGVFPFFRPIIEGVLRRTTGPEGMLRHVPAMLTRAARNITIHIETYDARAEIVLESRDLHETRASAEAWAGAAEALFALAGGDSPIEVISIRPGASISEIRLGLPLRVAP